MKKVFSILLTLAMLINVGIVAMADDGETTPVNLWEAWGNFDSVEPTSTATYNDVDYITKIGDLSTTITSVTNNKILMQLSSEAYHGDSGKSLHVSQLATSSSPTISGITAENSAVGDLYKISAYVKRNNTRSTTTFGFTVRTSGDPALAVTGWNENGTMKTAIKSYSKDNATPKAGTITLETTDWLYAEGYFYMVKDADTLLGFANGKFAGNYFIDDIKLEKVGSNGTIDSEDGNYTIKKSRTADVTANFSYTGYEKIAATSEIALAEAYTGVSIENGVLTVTPEAEAGTIQLVINKTLAGTETAIATREVVIEENLAESPNNLIVGGTFETEDYEGYTGTQAYSHATVVGATDEAAYSGSKSLKVQNPDPFYPVTFKVDLDKGAVYKFTAYVKLTADSNAVSQGVNLTAVPGRQMDGNASRYLGVYTFGTNGTKYDAGYAYRTSNKTTGLSTTDWTKFERYIYVSDETAADSEGKVTTYIGIKHTQEVAFNCYLDDVSLIKLGEFAGADGIDIPADSTSATYTFTPVAEGDYTVALKEDYEGATIADNALTVTSSAASGSAYVQVKSGTQVIAEKEVALFDETGVVSSIGTPGSTGSTLYNARVSKTAAATKPALLIANYGTSGTAFNKVSINNFQEMNGCWKLKSYYTISKGTNKFMVWDGITTMKPLADAATVERS